MLVGPKAPLHKIVGRVKWQDILPLEPLSPPPKIPVLLIDWNTLARLARWGLGLAY